MRLKRFRGDTYPESFILNTNNTPTNLDLITRAEFSIRKPSGVQILTGVKDGDSSTGRVVFEFTDTVTKDIGVYPYDIQGILVGGIIVTFVKDIISFADDVNKT